MNGLDLIITKNDLAVFESNIADLETYVAERLKEYDPATYTGDADAAKKARAELNAAKKELSSKRISLTRERENKDPFTIGMNRIHRLEKQIDEVSGKLDAIVKEKEAKEKAARLESVKFMWQKQGFDYTDFDKVLARFGGKWLNKSMKSNDILLEMQSAIKEMENALKMIEKFTEDAEEVKAYYLNCLDLQAACTFGDERVQARKRVALEKAEREEREKERVLAEQARAAAQERREVERKEYERLDSEKAEFVRTGTFPDTPKEEECEYTVTIKCYPSAVPLIKDALTASRIVFTSFEKLEF